MSDTTTIVGRVQGAVIELERPLPELEGKRVQVLVRPADDDERILTPVEQAQHWETWRTGHAQGPIEDEGEDFPG